MEHDNKSLFRQAETLQEVTATFLENAVHSMGVLREGLDDNSLDEDELIALVHWYDGLKKAAKNIRGID